MKVDPTIRKYTDKRTLLEKALAVPIKQRTNGNYNFQQIELALAWLQGKVTVTQIAVAMNTRPGTIHAKMGTLLRHAYNTGKLIVKE